MRLFALLLSGVLLLAGCAAGDQPTRLRIMVPNVAGGGYDVTARTAAAIAQRAGVVDQPIAVFNVDGDGGAVALRRLLAERGNGELAMMMGLGVVGATVTSPGADQVTAATPIARLVEESQAVLVPANSPHRSIGELVSAWRADPASTAIGGGSATGGPDHLMAMRLADAVSSVVEFAAQISSGQLRVLAVSGPARLPGVDAPTLTEAGFAVVFTNWRGMLAPPGISPADRDRLVDLLRRLEESPEWNATVQRSGWTNAFLAGDQFGAFLADQNRDVRATLTRLGLP